MKTYICCDFFPLFFGIFFIYVHWRAFCNRNSFAITQKWSDLRCFFSLGPFLLTFSLRFEIKEVPNKFRNNKIRSVDYNNYVMPLWICEWIKWARSYHQMDGFLLAFFFLFFEFRSTKSKLLYGFGINWVGFVVAIGVDIYSWLFIIFDIFMEHKMQLNRCKPNEPNEVPIKKTKTNCYYDTKTHAPDR